MQMGILRHCAGDAIPPQVVQLGERGRKFAARGFHRQLVAADFADLHRANFKLFRHDFLAADDACESTQRIIHGFGVGKEARHVWLQHDHVRAALVAPEILATHTG
jgi:hypothetical protein